MKDGRAIGTIVLAVILVASFFQIDYFWGDEEGMGVKERKKEERKDD